MTSTPAFFVLFVFLCASLVHGQGYHRLPNTFQMEEKIVHPIPIPETAFHQLWVSDHNRYIDDTPQRLRQRLAGAKIDLDGDSRLDLLVQGDNGANITGFWIFHNEGKRQRLVLDTRGLGLFLLKRSHHGLRDIEVGAATATTLHTAIYRFDGRRYSSAVCWLEDLGVDHAKKHYVSCR